MKSSAPKDEAPQKFVAKIQYNDHRICKVKKISISNTFDEAKACKARKRKERQESVSSLYQERKVIRSSSEERPITLKGPEDRDNGIRRVSSSGDFPKSASEEKAPKSPLKKHEQSSENNKTLAYDDHEHDKRRSHERFARPYALKSRKYLNKRIKVRCSSRIRLKSESQDSTKKNASAIVSDHEATGSTKFLDLRPQEPDEQSTSPVHTPITPVLDFTTLHEQVDSFEPVLSQPSYQVDENTETLPSQFVASSRLLSSPRNSIIATHRIFLDPDVPQANAKKLSQNPIDERLQKLVKQINSCKRKIMVSEADFEDRTGAKPSQFDKLNDETMRKLYVELSKLKKEQKQLSEISVGAKANVGKMRVEPGEKPASLEEIVKEIELTLLKKRESGNRNFNLESMTSEELIEEKIATQKALLFLESVHGRPQTKEERDMVRPFYDRYRTLKRMMAKISSVGISGGDLATIHENEAMHFVTPTSSSNETESEKTETPSTTNRDSDRESSSDVDNFHSLTKSELIEQVKVVTEEKKGLRREIKEFEAKVQAKTCRMLTKDDKKPIEDLYVAYKKVKGRLRLLEALVAKY